MPATKEEATNVQFRLGGQALKQLERIANAYELSPGQFARRILVEYLEDTERVRLRERLAALECEYKQLREDFAVSVEALMLILATEQKPSHDEIKEWIQTYLRSE